MDTDPTDFENELHTLLPTSKDTSAPSFDRLGYHTCSCQKASTSLTKCASLLCITCTLLNVLLFVSTSRTSEKVFCHDKLAAMSPEDISQLRRPSPYVGLDKISHIQNDYEPSSIINYPHVIAQVDSLHPDMIFDDDPARYLSHTGTVSPQQRQVRITSSVSTIVQFQAIDYGMSICEINLRLPPHDDTNLTQPYSISIHRVSSQRNIDTKSLRYRTRPQIISTMGTMHVPDLTLWSKNITCAWDELVTFQLSCNDPSGNDESPCSVSWWQDESSDNPSQGVFIRQYAG